MGLAVCILLAPYGAAWLSLKLLFGLIGAGLCMR
jgi:hypothetical protein